MIQAPKIFTSKDDTLLSLKYLSPSLDKLETAYLDCAVYYSSGDLITKWKEKIQPYTCKLISFKQKLIKKFKDELSSNTMNFTYIGFSRNSTVIPITFLHNKKLSTLAIGIVYRQIIM